MKMVGIKAKRWTETQYSNRRDTARRVLFLVTYLPTIDSLYRAIDFMSWREMGGFISLQQK